LRSAQREVQVAKRLRRGATEQVVDRRDDHRVPAIRMNGEASDRDMVFPGDVTNERRIGGQLYHRLVLVGLLVAFEKTFSRLLAGERHGNRDGDPPEERGDMRSEEEATPELPPYLALVDVIDERIGKEVVAERL